MSYFANEILSGRVVMSNDPNNRYIDRRVAHWMKREKKIGLFPSNNFFGVVWYCDGLWYAFLTRYGCVHDVIIHKKLTEVYRMAYNRHEMREYEGKLDASGLIHAAMWKRIETASLWWNN